MKVKDVADRLEVSTKTVYAIIAAKKLGCVRVGNGRGVFRVTEEQFAAYIASASSVPLTAPAAAPAPEPPPKRMPLKYVRHRF